MQCVFPQIRGHTKRLSWRMPDRCFLMFRPCTATDPSYWRAVASTAAERSRQTYLCLQAMVKANFPIDRSDRVHEPSFDAPGGVGKRPYLCGDALNELPEDVVLKMPVSPRVLEARRQQ